MPRPEGPTHIEQAAPFTVNAAGAAFVPVQLAMKPNVTDPFAGTVPFQGVLATVTAAPFWA